MSGMLVSALDSARAKYRWAALTSPICNMIWMVNIEHRMCTLCLSVSVQTEGMYTCHSVFVQGSYIIEYIILYYSKTQTTNDYFYTHLEVDAS